MQSECFSIAYSPDMFPLIDRNKVNEEIDREIQNLEALEKIIEKRSELFKEEERSKIEKSIALLLKGLRDSMDRRADLVYVTHYLDRHHKEDHYLILVIEFKETRARDLWQLAISSMEALITFKEIEKIGRGKGKKKALIMIICEGDYCRVVNGELLRILQSLSSIMKATHFEAKKLKKLIKGLINGKEILDLSGSLPPSCQQSS